MNITNRQVLQAVDGLNELSELELPVRVAFKITKITRKLQSVIDTYNEVLKKLQEKHVERDEDGKEIVYQDGNVTRLQLRDGPAFEAEYQELLDQESELEITQLKIDELGDIQLKSSTLFKCDWLFLE